MSETVMKDEKAAAELDTNIKGFQRKKRMHSKNVHEPKFTVPMRKKWKNQYDPTEEARLEKIVFGDPSDIISKLPNEDDLGVLNERDNANDPEIENADISTNDVAQSKQTKKAAWEDEDDAEYSVQDAFQAQNRRQIPQRPEKLYKDMLHNKYKQLVGTPKWAEFKKEDADLDDLDTDILKHSCHLEKAKVKSLPKSIIEIKALTQINKQTHTEGPMVTSLEFHPTSTVALVAGKSGILSLFQVDGIENNKLHSMQYKKFPISRAKFLNEGTEVILGSEYYAHCHSYNLMSGKTYRVPLPHGMTNMKTFEVSPDGKLLAVCGRLGEVYLLTSSTKELVGTLKMNAKCRAISFTPDSKTLITHGDGSEMYFWDVNSRACVHRAIDDGCLSCSSIAVSPSGQFLATGTKEGVVNLYDTQTALAKHNPAPLKIVLNLVTSITSLKFNPLSEILAMSSDQKDNAFRMIHLPSFTVFSNFPTFQTQIFKPKTVDFSPSSGYLGISNSSGHAFLYRLKHYGNY